MLINAIDVGQHVFKLETPVPIMQKTDEFALLLERIAGVSRILEIGRAQGGTLYHFARNINLAAHDSGIVSVDDNSEHYWQRKDFPFDGVPEAKIAFIHGDSTDQSTVDKVREHQFFDVIFIDGNHSYKYVSQDWENYSPMIRSGGIVVFHDIVEHTHMPQVEVQRLWREIQAFGYPTQEIISTRDISPWGGIGVVYCG